LDETKDSNYGHKHVRVQSADFPMMRNLK